ncbi:hypothetical protein ACE939_00900 [Aquimarina sp. W85]|uniref:hypothetical protein n=1 Tax=Aquimarina rhodophyticola TaxID=3342246 RepID=UPI003672FE2E
MKFFVKYYYSILKKWFYQNLTKKGRKEKFFAEGLKNINAHLDQNKEKAKMNMLKTAGSLLTTKKIMGFNGKKSITKAKTTNHKLKHIVDNKHSEELKKNMLKIQKNTLVIKDA